MVSDATYRVGMAVLRDLHDMTCDFHARQKGSHDPGSLRMYQHSILRLPEMMSCSFDEFSGSLDEQR